MDSVVVGFLCEVPVSNKNRCSSARVEISLHAQCRNCQDGGPSDVDLVRKWRHGGLRTSRLVILIDRG